MLYDIIIVIAALAVLLKASDYLIESAAKLAKAIGISEFFIGVTIIAFGTSLPELVSAIAAATYNSPGLILGNIVGSNIANIALVLAIAAVIAPLAIQKRMFSREGLFLLGITIAFLLMGFNGMVGMLEGIIFLVLFLLYLVYLVETEVFHGALRGFFKDLLTARFGEGLKELKTSYNNHKNGVKKNAEADGISPETYTALFILKHLAVIVVACFALYFSSKYLVPSAHNIALAMRIPDSIIGITLIALGTSLPELVVSIVAVKKGKGDLLVGNILGSNIANILLVIGVSAVIIPLPISGIMLYYFMPVMLLLVILFLAFIRTNWVVRMVHGFVFLLIYVVFIAVMVYLVKQGYGLPVL
ncbi:MAG: calcium/sodium antiporter [Nanoarchaeota archaeon]|nr:calcium/sodium antiporter [Nanoarchaeota archaeon]